MSNCGSSLLAIFLLSPLVVGCAAGRPVDNHPPDHREFSTIGDAFLIQEDMRGLTLPDLGGADIALSGPDGGANGQCATVDIVINEVQTDGVSASDEFVELFNPCGGTVDLTDYKLVYRSAAGGTDTTLTTLSQTIGALGYLVLANSGYSGTADGVISNGMAKAGGGVALKDPAGAYLDSVAWGTATNAFIEGTVASAPGTSQSLARTPNGNDTDHNSTDFTVATPTPRAAN